MDDALFAGAVVRELAEEYRIIDDSTLSTKLLYRYVRENMLRTIKQATHFKRLARLGIENDIKFCNFKISGNIWHIIERKQKR